VAKDPRLLYSCAHLVYDYYDGWASRFAFSRRHNGPRAPKSSSYAVARGYRVLAGYNPQPIGFEEFDVDFDDDFAVAYGGVATDFGPVLPANADPIASITNEKIEKRIVGYPADLDDSPYENTGGYYMYETGPMFLAYRDYNDDSPRGEYRAEWTTTGSGNSGGPLVVWDPSSGTWQLAAILVSGSYYWDWDDYGEPWFSGVHVLDEDCDDLANEALGYASVGGTTTRSNTLLGPIADGKRAYASRSFDFSSADSPDSGGPAFGVASEVTNVLVDLDITANRRGDIDAYIRSPRGRTEFVAKSSADPAVANQPDVLLNGYSAPAGKFFGSSPRGVWRLFFRDSVSGNPSSFNSAALTLSTRWPR
jgi:hypothetical protein